MRSLAPAAVLLLAALGAGPASAQSAPNGFMLRMQAEVAAPRARVYDALLRIGSWWNAEHTYSGDASKLSLDARVGGCWCEDLGSGGGIEHGRVIYVVPGEVLRLSGALGPLQEWGAIGSLTWSLAEAAGTTTVELSYGVGGYFDGGLEHVAGAVEGVLHEQLGRLKRYVETGSAN